MCSYNFSFELCVHLISGAGKARRLKQAKDEAQADIEKFRQERERQFKEYEAKVKLGYPMCGRWSFVVW